MSTRTPAKSSSREVGKTPSTAKTPGLSKSRLSGRLSNISGRAGAKPAEEKEKKEFELPALSLGYKQKIIPETELEKLRRKTIRRNAPPGEDLKQIKKILKSITGQAVTVQEFISLIAPSTGDQGEVLRLVMQDDLNSFRKLARKVYDTITQDNSDVIHNQQLQLAEFYKEKKTLLQDKMMRSIEEIYAMAPNFSFDKYAADKEKYLNELFPIPEELDLEPEEMEMMKRQAAYHRLQWLRSEGERLNEENNSLKKRLNQLKHLHQKEQMSMMQMEREAEAKKNALEVQQAKKFDTLEKLNESLEKTIISQERSMREEKDRFVVEPVSSRKDLKKTKLKGAVKKRRPAWNEEAAKEVETRILEESYAADVANVSKSLSTGQRPTRPQSLPPRKPGSAQLPPRYGRRPSEGRRDSWGGFH